MRKQKVHIELQSFKGQHMVYISPSHALSNNFPIYTEFTTETMQLSVTSKSCFQCWGISFSEMVDLG
jgi:hypothetical protein